MGMEILVKKRAFCIGRGVINGRQW